MTPAGFEPTSPASEWPQTFALDRSATGIGINSDTKKKHFPQEDGFQEKNLVLSINLRQ